ncbi:helix-turn-helix domain-containing protein [Actinocatenispora rupis]|uniref:Transcriptional regulator n=1 Tax=Actinocatenispora rupis TaxID=519421 RepID=A0A8J3IYN9_9ACTN|nr:helix-turn-helix transcriptional regulator [Actinocatenispora rupis]GID11235.1 transcriptional regulator [Actinocatenispora rupis]
MPDTGSTVPRRQLGRQARALRRAAGYTAEIAADELGWSRHKIWRIEKGKVSATKSDMIAMASLYRADAETTELLIALAAESRAKGWWHSTLEGAPTFKHLYVDLERVAGSIREYSANLVCGLLQTKDYCWAISRVASTASRETIEERVSFRMKRQAILTREDPPAPRLSVILDEPAIRRPIGGTRVMEKQIHALIEATDLPNVDVRVLPFAAGAHASLDTNFIILEFPENRESPIVYLEPKTGGLYLDKPREVTAYNFAMRDLEERALSARESRDFLARAAKEL